MKKLFDAKSMRFKLWTYFALFAGVIMLLLWLLQIVFLQTYYDGMKTKQIMNVGEQITKNYGSTDFQNNIDELAYKNSLIVIIGDTSGKIITTSNIGSFEQPTRPILVNFSTFLNKLLKSTNGEVCYSEKNMQFNSKTLIYGAILDKMDGNNLFLYISSPLTPVESTVSVLQSQLIYVIITVLILSVILSYFISNRISKPITQISKTATELAKGNYHVLFENAGYTEIDELASTLNYATKELSKTDELRRELIANVSHDLKTPLTMVKAYAEMIQDISGNNPEKRNAHTKVIIAEADRLTTLVNDVLDISKLQSGNVKHNMQVFNLSNTLKSIMNRFDFLKERDGYNFTLNIEEDIEINADKSKIEQVIYNLISNAINYTGDDKMVNICLNKNGDFLRFEVTDTGKGIPKEEIDCIWERYYNTKQTHKRSVVGTGLGLSIVKNILIYYNAKYGVVSEVGKGSKFWFEMKIYNVI